MTLYSPTPSLSDSDKRLLFLLAKLLLERMDVSDDGSNLPSGGVVLSDKEAGELLNLIESLVNSREFLEASYFVEGMAEYGTHPDTRLREIYLSARKRRGRSRALASTNWSDFLIRLGFRPETRLVRSSRRMSQEYFLNMEEKLLSSLRLHPRVIKLVMQIIRIQSPNVEQIRNGNGQIRRGTLRALVADPYFRWRASELSQKEFQITTNKIVSSIIIVADFSILFTTRDWSVAGTLSAMSGAAATLVAD